MTYIVDIESLIGDIVVLGILGIALIIRLFCWVFSDKKGRKHK